jgi:hypothetical protein
MLRQRKPLLNAPTPFSFRRAARIAIHQATLHCKATTVTSMRKM